MTAPNRRDVTLVRRRPRPPTGHPPKSSSPMVMLGAPKMPMATRVVGWQGSACMPVEMVSTSVSVLQRFGIGRLPVVVYGMSIKGIEPHGEAFLRGSVPCLWMVQLKGIARTLRYFP